MDANREQLLDQNYSITTTSRYQYPSLEQNPEFWGNGIKRLMIVGRGSDIAKAMRERFIRDGWLISGVGDRWDLALFARGTLEPIGRFVDCDPECWEESIAVNALQPLRDFRALLPSANHNASAVFFGGTNPSKAAPTYSAYASAKALLREAVKTIKAEGFNAVMLDPGVVRTKIHDATMKAGKRAANYERVMNIVSGAEPTVTHDEVYAKLKALL